MRRDRRRLDGSAGSTRAIMAKRRKHVGAEAFISERSALLAAYDKAFVLPLPEERLADPVVAVVVPRTPTRADAAEDVERVTITVIARVPVATSQMDGNAEDLVH